MEEQLLPQSGGYSEPDQIQNNIFKEETTAAAFLIVHITTKYFLEFNSLRNSYTQDDCVCSGFQTGDPSIKCPFLCPLSHNMLKKPLKLHTLIISV